MLRAENLIWIDESDGNKEHRFHKFWSYKMRFAGEDCDTPFLMGEEAHNTYLAEVEIIKKIDALKLSPKVRRALLDKIEAYGEARNEAGRRDVEEDWAESDAGAGL